ncbi:MAG: 1,4-alpha-glucan branching protein GlgB [Acidobacteriota bacterium]|nr:1,4-alpha-glucan branching protein GlgB [Acidobacteriota bacterium]
MPSATLPSADVDAIAKGLHPDPFAVLGPHEVSGGLAIRAFRPNTRAIEGFARIHPEGVYEQIVPDATREGYDYRLRVAWADGSMSELDDPYRYGPVITDFDLHLLGEGTHHRLYETLGARTITHGIRTGVHFAVWAPNALRVSVVGDFNSWDGRVHPMRAIRPAGYWEIFLPDLGQGDRYKFEVLGADGRLVLKADPCGRYFETPPRTASIVWNSGNYEWQDRAWMKARETRGQWLRKPMSIYEVHLGSWQRSAEGGLLSYRDMAERLVPYVQTMGFTHVEMLPVMEHPFTGSWGYQVIGFFAPTSRFGTPEDFKALVDAFHAAGIGVILDWVPGHFPKDLHGLARFDGTALYEHADPRQGEHQDWGTLVFNYGRHEVRSFLLSNALFWLKEFHIDGLRVDAVASMLYLDYSREAGQWVPNEFGGRENLEAIEFIKQLNMVVDHECPGVVMCAEESTSWPGVTRPVHLGGLGFTYKWNMGWMHDMLDYTREDPVHRKWHHNKITFSMIYAYSERFILPFSHDEVVHGKRSMLDKMPGDAWQKHANLRALYGYMFAHPGKKLLFMGGEIGQWREWNHDWQIDWEVLGDPAQAGLQKWIRDLNRVYAEQQSLWDLDHEPSGFSWIDCNDHEHSLIALTRRAANESDFTVAIVNFTPVARRHYRVGVPVGGAYRELLNSDAALYGGSNIGNQGRVESEPLPLHGFKQSIALTVPPLGFLLLRPE